MSNNNVSVKSIVDNMKTKYNTSSTADSSSSTDNLVVKIKNKLSSNLKYWLMIALPILLILFYLLYNYSLGSRSNNIISTMNYKSKLKNTPLPQCFQQDVKYQFKICDYYISSSYMTPCVGNQHYDYVSNEMLTEVLKSGARYIQIPICEADVSLQALPVVATAEYGQRLITSLNTLDITSVFKNIRANAFILNNKSINYPLIIHLILNTTNLYTLNFIAQSIKDIFMDVLIDVSKYKTFPIFLDKLCNVLGKIIIIATPEYYGTNLEQFIVPTNKLFNIYHYSELAALNLPDGTLFTSLYNNKLSAKAQKKNSLKFKTKYQDKGINYIVTNADTVGDTILNDGEILNNLTSFNKVGVSLVKPHYSVDVATKNYDITESIYFGCQLICMNFQINDVYMQNYLEIFKDSSFRLKPSSMRFTEKEEPIADLLSLYNNIMKKNNNILNDFYYKYNNKLVSFEAYSLPNTYLTQIENNLKFDLGANQIKNKFNDITYKIDISQCFIPRKSTIGASDNISIYLESAAISGLYITLSSGIFNLQPLGRKKQELINQAIYIEKPKTIDKEQLPSKGEMISIRNFADENSLYLAFENKNVKAYFNTPQVQSHNNMTFFVKEIKHNIIIN